MGCSYSTKRRRKSSVSLKVFVTIPLSVSQKYLVRETWEIIEPQQRDIGKKMMLRFFEMDPAFQKLFPEFKDISLEELENARALHGHAKRVMKGVEKAVSAMDDAESFAAYLEELGRRHIQRAMKPAYLDAMNVALMSVLAELLQSQWTVETSRAWKNLFKFISDSMQRATNMGCSASAVSHQPMSMSLSTAQKYLITETWETIEINKIAVGKKTFIRFFEVNPEYQKLFPEFKSVAPNDLEKTNALYGHAKRVMKAVENAVSSMEDAETFSAYLEELGRRHKTRALKPTYLDSMREALMYSLEDLLRSQWTGETSLAWEELFKFISSTMIKGLQS